MDYQMIPISMMKVDSSYQRQPDNRKVKRIAENWSDSKANLVHVSHRKDGFYYVIDGNHTRLACQKKGGTELACRVHEGLTIEEEAKLFYELNSSQKKPSFGEMLKAKATAGCELEKTYLQMFDELGIKYSFTHSRGCKIKCHAALLSIYRKTTYQLMSRALSVANQAADGREAFYQIGFFPGLCSLIVQHPEIDDSRLISQVKKHSSSRIKELADGYRRSAISGSSSTTREFRRAYIDIYNKGLRRNKIVEQGES